MKTGRKILTAKYAKYSENGFGFFVRVFQRLRVCLCLCFGPLVPIGILKRTSPRSTAEVLRKVIELPISSWGYKAEDRSVRHIGPVAQDFYAAFALGQDDRHIVDIDEGGVALAAIQGLNQKLNEKDATMAELKKATIRFARAIREFAEANGRSKGTLQQIVVPIPQNSPKLTSWRCGQRNAVGY